MRRPLPTLALASALTVAVLPWASAQAQSPFDGLTFRSVGPAVMGGRIHDVEVDPKDPSTIYVAAAGGGVWKTTNHGILWTPIFDETGENSFGDLAIFAGDTKIVWAGTGEQNNRQSSTWGGGVYRSTDGGATWKYVGLRETASIARVLLHPTDPNIAWVAAAGNLWKPTSERGVYKTTDAGATWTKVLAADSVTGANEILIDPRNPQVLYASLYSRLRSSFGFNGGGAGSGLFKSTDGGATWNKIENGFPAGDKGRIGLSIAMSKPDVLVATVEHATGSGTYRTEDGGATWKRMSGTNPRPMYFSHPTIDPNNDQRVWMMGVQPSKSENGGATFEPMPNSPTYDLGLKDDHHSLWIDPRDSRHVLLGGDGGLHESWDLGYTYARLNNFAIGQFYRVAVDDRDPYWIYGGMQDAHSWMGPSATTHWLGILNQDWLQIGFSDGTGQAVDLKGHRYVYSTSSGGNITRVDVITGDRWDIQPVAPSGESYRFDWTAPVVASKHKAGTVYLGANKLLTSRDFGSTWTASGDLTKALNRDTLVMAGVKNSDIRLSRNDGETNFSEITTIAEHPVSPLVLWVGTDDGNIQVSKDGGKTFTEVGKNIAGVPALSFVDRIVASAASPGTAYATIENHRIGDFTPYIFKTTDFGATWTKVTDGLPNGLPVRSIAEFPGVPQVLLAGTERFLYYTMDAGAHWTQLKANLPPTRYDDIVIHPRTKDIVLATHGRSIWVLDDATPLVKWAATASAAAPAKATLFPVRQATLTLYRADVSTAAHAFFAAENPAEGATFTYFLPKAVDTVRFTVTNAAGKTVRTFTAPAKAGLVQRASWDLRWPAPTGGFGGFGGGGEEAGGPPAAPAGGGTRAAGGAGRRPALPIPAHDIGPRGFHVAPGTFTVTMIAGSDTAKQTFSVRGDPSSDVTLLEHKAREAFLVEATEVSAKLTAATTAFRAKLQGATGAEQQKLQAVAQKLGLAPAAGGRGGRGGRGGPGAGLQAAIGGYYGSGVRQASMKGPTGTHLQQLAAAKAALATLQAALK
ncbi:MAG: hypothetical protein K2R93_19040 [Gemmatimonadaceae bacterium]|nr:hypothetical protein [Gemmatimonadaceae bacterium]